MAYPPANPFRNRATPIGGTTWLGSVPVPGGAPPPQRTVGDGGSPYARLGQGFGDVHTISQGEGGGGGGMGGGRGFGGGGGGYSMGRGSPSMAGTERDEYGRRVAGGRLINSGRINARAGLSSATGRGLADFYAGNAIGSNGMAMMPSAWELQQNRMNTQQGWGQPMPNQPLNQPGGIGAGIGGMSGPLQPPQGLNGGVGGTNPPGGPPLPRREKGGPVKGGVQPYIVGEAGPELIVPKHDGKVIPHKKTVQMLREAGMNQPQYRENGGDVQGVNPYAMRYAQQQQRGGEQQEIASLMQEGERAGYNMSQAPDSVNGLRRFLSLGRRTNWRSALPRAAPQTEIIEETFRENPVYGNYSIKTPYGRGTVVQVDPSERKVGMFRQSGLTRLENPKGKLEYLPFSTPRDSWQTSWQQNETLLGMQDRARKAGQTYKTVDQILPGYTVDDLID